jgi:hypothetical protein
MVEHRTVTEPGAAAPAGGKNTRPKGCGVGRCKNCTGDGVRIMREMGMCHSCIRHARGTKGEDRVRALAEAAEIYGKLKPGERAAARSAARKAGPPAGMPPVEGNQGTCSQGAPPPVEENPAQEAPGGAIADVVMSLVFHGEGDEALYARLCAEAVRERRSPEQQALALLEDALDILEVYRAWKGGRQ